MVAKVLGRSADGVGPRLAGAVLGYLPLMEWACAWLVLPLGTSLFGVEIVSYSYR